MSGWQEFKQKFAQCSSTDKLLTCFTGAIVVISIIQACIYAGQYKSMRIEGRAWMNILTSTPQFAKNDAGQTLLTAQYAIINSGKTAALKFHAEWMFDIVKNGETPAFEIDDFAKNTATSNVIYAGTGTQNGSGVKDFHSANPRVLSDADVKQLEDGKDYFISYGTIAYDDVFGHSHLMHFCTFSSMAKKSVEIKSIACTNYNKIDDNY